MIKNTYTTWIFGAVGTKIGKHAPIVSAVYYLSVSRKADRIFTKYHDRKFN